MTVRLILGAQWGDEGKGKVTDLLAEDADVIVRFQGGNNAGHTIQVKGETFKLHLVPSGVVRGKRCLVGAGCVVDPGVLLKELEQLSKRGIRANLGVSDRAHVITALHRLLDGAEEEARGGKAVGTTKRGIGPAYADKMSRAGLRVGDLLDPAALEERAGFLYESKSRYLHVLGAAMDEVPSRAEFLAELQEWGRSLRPYVTDTLAEVHGAWRNGSNIVLEGAQGALLDVDWGTYPFVTSSSPTAGGAATGSGLSPRAVDEVWAIAKAYTTRVGGGPFPTELDAKGGPGKHLLEVGREFGTTTGRPRRCGWLDLVVLKHAHRLSGFTHVFLTKADVLAGLDTIRVATHYRTPQGESDHFPADLARLAASEPVYEELPGFRELPARPDWKDLPEGLQGLVKLVEHHLGVPVAGLSYGPGREESLLRKAA